MTLEEIKKEEIEILKKIDEICKKNNLNYSLAGGSAIGAVRHQGFIPWDDDIDIMMLREDYNKLQKIMGNESYRGIKLLSIENNKNFPYPFNKAVSLNTYAKEIGIEKIEDYGVFIDIFPIDKVPEKEKELKRYIKKVKILKKIYLIKLYKEQISSSKTKLLAKKLISFLLKPINLYKTVNKLDKLFKKYDSSKSNYYGLIFALDESNAKHYYPKEFFANTKKIKFENVEFSIIRDYDRYLKDRYGDYMKLPNENKRITNHNWEYVELKNNK